MQADWALGLGVVLTAVLAVFGGLLAMSALPRRAGKPPPSIFADQGGGAVFLFDGETLVDANTEARALLATNPAQGDPWITMSSTLAPHFPDLAGHLARLVQNGGVTLTSALNQTSPLLLRADLRGGLTRITLIDPEQDGTLPGQDPLAQRALHEELDLLRQTVADAPLLIWRERADGEVIWANAGYLMRAGEQMEPGQDLS